MSEKKITAEERELAESFGLDPQPDPVTNDRPSAHDLVSEMLQQRKEFGLAKYNTPLQAFNGRNPAIDALEEAADLIVYLQCLKDEWQARIREAYANGMEAGVMASRNKGFLVEASIHNGPEILLIRGSKVRDAEYYDGDGNRFYPHKEYVGSDPLYRVTLADDLIYPVVVVA